MCTFLVLNLLNSSLGVKKFHIAIGIFHSKLNKEFVLKNTI